MVCFAKNDSSLNYVASLTGLDASLKL